MFQSLTKNLDSFPELKISIRSILMEGARISYNGQQDEIVQMEMYGLIRNDNDTVRISNRIFETMLYNLFLTEEEMRKDAFAREGGFNTSWNSRYGEANDTTLEAKNR